MITLNRPYMGYLSGTVVQLPTSTEQALIAQGLASTSAGPVTSGPVTVAATVQQGRVVFAAAAASLVVTHAGVTAESKVSAVVAQAAADGTLLRIERIVCANGSFTLYGTAAATAATTVDWVLHSPSGLSTTN